MTRVSGIMTALSACALALASAPSRADVRPSGFRVHSEGWTFVPVVSQTDGTTSVPGILALRYKPEAVGNNIVAVWYNNPGSTGGDWNAMAWTSSDQAKAIQCVKNTFGISNDWDVLWPTTDYLEGAVAETPADYSKGLLTSDALFAYSTTGQHDELVSALTAIGYDAADIPIDRTGAECEQGAVLFACAEGAMYTATTPTATTDSIIAQPFAGVLLTCAMAGGGIPTTLPPPGLIPGTTIPCPGSPLNPGWTLDPGDNGTIDPTCSTSGTSCCYKRTIRYLYIKPGIFWDATYYCQSDVTWSCPPPAGGGCPATPPASCPAPAGPYFPPAGWTIDCDNPL